MHILDQEAPGLSERLRAVSGERNAIAVNHRLSGTRVAEAHSLAETADDKYFSLQESNRPENEWLNWFYKARLLTAIARSFSGDSWQDAADAACELSKSRKAPSPIF